MTKVLSFVIESEQSKLTRTCYDYPEIEKLTQEGWMLVDTLPMCSNGSNYLVTFILVKDEESMRKKRSR